jgi:toxin ParE1/3/4
MPRAERDLLSIFLYIGAESSPAAEDWFRGLVDAIASLAEHPLRNPKTPENRSLRHLLHGNKPHIYRVIYLIDPPRKRVDILHVRHSAQSAFTPPEVQ